MADHSTVMSEDDISALKDTLRAQQQLLQKLYNELDAEREASASAASEALSVILRLQEEKAAVKMEAEQYKRLSEEKMCHAEESLAIIEDIIYQKEMEVAALDYQVQAYRCKLLSMGCVDPGTGEIRFPDNPFQRSENLAGETSLRSIGRRNSEPVSIKYKKALCERESLISPEIEVVPKIVADETSQEMYDQVSDSDKKIDNSATGGIISYWEQIRRLDVRVKEMAGGASYTSSRSETRSSSPHSSHVSAGNSCNLSNSANLGKETWSPSSCEVDRIKVSANLVNNGVSVDYHPSSPSVHDVFEVPQVDQSLSSCESVAKCANRTACQGSGSLKREIVHPEAVKEPYTKDEPDWLKKVLQSTHPEKTLPKPINVADIDCRFAAVQPRASVTESLSRLHQLNRTSEIIEERPAEYNKREEELKLLNEIKEQLSSLHDELRTLQVKKSSMRDKPSVRDEPSLCLLREAMLYFWL